MFASGIVKYIIVTIVADVNDGMNICTQIYNIRKNKFTGTTLVQSVITVLLNT